MSANTPNDAKEWVEERIRRAVAASALREIRGLVNEHEAEDRFARRVSRIVLWSLAAVVVALAVAGAIFGLEPIIRSLTGIMK